MDFKIKSQLSALILTALVERDMYGLEIIQDILVRSNGDVSIKQPSLYSNLKRMEEAGYISSYWRDSSIGGNRHYYSITDFGKKLYNEMQLEIFAAQRRMRRVISPDAKPVPPVLAAMEEITELKEIKEKQTELKEEHPGKPTILEQQSLFTFNNPDAPSTIKVEKASTENSSSQYDMFNTKPEPDPSKNDAVLFDKNGFVLNRPERMTLNEHIEYKHANKLEKVAEPEPTPVPVLEPAKEEVVEQIPVIEEKVIEQPIYPKEIISPVEEPISVPKYVEPKKDDAVFITARKEKDPEDDQGVLITARPTVNELPKVKRIAPANIDIYAKINKLNMPEPVKETMYSPTDRRGNKSFNQLIGSLYSRGSNNEEKEVSFASYKELKEHYSEKGIWFQEYSKAAKERVYKTNKIHFFRSVLIMIFTCLITAGSYFLFESLGYTRDATNFIYIIPPILAALMVMYYGYQWVQTQSKPPKKPWSIYLSGGLWVLAIAIILGVHILVFSTWSVSDTLIRASTLLFPCIIFAIVPLNTIVADLLYKKLKF